MIFWRKHETRKNLRLWGSNYIVFSHIGHLTIIGSWRHGNDCSSRAANSRTLLRYSCRFQALMRCGNSNMLCGVGSMCLEGLCCPLPRCPNGIISLGKVLRWSACFCSVMVLFSLQITPRTLVFQMARCKTGIWLEMSCVASCSVYFPKRNRKLEIFLRLLKRRFESDSYPNQWRKKLWKLHNVFTCEQTGSARTEIHSCTRMWD